MKQDEYSETSEYSPRLTRAVTFSTRGFYELGSVEAAEEVVETAREIYEENYEGRISSGLANLSGKPTFEQNGPYILARYRVPMILNPGPDLSLRQAGKLLEDNDDQEEG